MEKGRMRYCPRLPGWQISSKPYNYGAISVNDCGDIIIDGKFQGNMSGIRYCNAQAFDSIFNKYLVYCKEHPERQEIMYQCRYCKHIQHIGNDVCDKCEDKNVNPDYFMRKTHAKIQDDPLAWMTDWDVSAYSVMG